jgi:hypothetical protein
MIGPGISTLLLGFIAIDSSMILKTTQNNLISVLTYYLAKGEHHAYG